MLILPTRPRNGVTVYKIDDQVLSALKREQVRDLLTGALALL